MLPNTFRNSHRKNKHQIDHWDLDHQEDFFTHQEFGRKHLLQEHLALLHQHYGMLYQDAYWMKVPLLYGKKHLKTYLFKVHLTCKAGEKLSHCILFTVPYQISHYHHHYHHHHHHHFYYYYYKRKESIYTWEQEWRLFKGKKKTPIYT